MSCIISIYIYTFINKFSLSLIGLINTKIGSFVQDDKIE